MNYCKSTSKNIDMKSKELDHENLFDILVHSSISTRSPCDMNHDINIYTWMRRREPRVPTDSWNGWFFRWSWQKACNESCLEVFFRVVFFFCLGRGRIWGISLVIVHCLGFGCFGHESLVPLFFVCLVPKWWVLSFDSWFLATWRIIPLSKWLGSPPFISHGVRPSKRGGTSPVRGLTITMVINHWT